MTGVLSSVAERIAQCMDEAERQAAWHLVRGEGHAWVHTSRQAATTARMLWDDMPHDRYEPLIVSPAAYADGVARGLLHPHARVVITDADPEGGRPWRY